MTSERYRSEYPPYDPTDSKGFSYETVVKRWPIIITNLIDYIYQVNHKLTMASEDHEDQIQEGNLIIQKASKLKYEMARDRVMQPIPPKGGPNIDAFNRELLLLSEQGLDTWFLCPWLFAECYLYRLIRTWFATTKHWTLFDPFLEQKEASFKSSAEAVYHLAHTMHELQSEHEALKNDETKLEILWGEMVQMCLWGNATDLSLLTNLTHEDIQKLQSVGKNAREKRQEFILRDDSKVAWAALRSHNGRVDIVLDNAGFELYTDLLFADFLVSHTPYVTQVHFHPKTIPWFVSDALPSDLTSLFTSLENSQSFFENASTFTPSASEKEAMSSLVKRWKEYFKIGKFKFSVPEDLNIGAPSSADFWTTPYPYWNMHLDDPTLFADLQNSSLVIFKGDLNYRKLTGDVKWPVSTPFDVSLGPLAGSFPILSLRTNKADVVVGLSDELAGSIEAKDPKWRVNGKYALISYTPRS